VLVRKIRFKLASAILAIYCLFGIGVIIFSGFGSKPFLNLLSYVFVFVLIPAFSTYGVWQRSKKAMTVSLFLFLSQSIRFIGGESWFPYFPPISLGIPFGNFANGQGYLIDFFAISMTIFLACLLWTSLPFNNYNKEI